MIVLLKKMRAKRAKLLKELFKLEKITEKNGNLEFMNHPISTDKDEFLWTLNLGIPRFNHLNSLLAL